jgi:hypothetical protein
VLSEAEMFFDAEEARLLLMLEENPAFQRLQAIRHARIVYRQTENSARVSRPVHAPAKSRAGSQSAAVQDASEAFLTLVNRRARTAEIVEYLHNIGVVESTDDQMVRTVSSYLSSARSRFDNQKGAEGGYGLVSWTSSHEPPENGLDIPKPRTPMKLPDFLRASSERMTADSEKEPAV